MAWNVFVSSLVVLLVLCSAIPVLGKHKDLSHNASTTLAGIELPDHMSFNAVSSSGSTGCSLPSSEKSKQGDLLMKQEALHEQESFDLDDDDEEEGEGGGQRSVNGVKETVKLHLKRRQTSPEDDPEKSLIVRDFARVHTLYRRMKENKNQNTISRLKNERILEENHGRAGRLRKSPAPASAPGPSTPAGLTEQLMATVESGVSLGSGEYFMDVFIGTPPKHFSLILDTGSDLNWIQCVPCHDCFEQNGPYYDPKDSTSYKNISCHDPRCRLVSSPDPPQPCSAKDQACPYYYWYGDSSNTTGDFALETFTVNLTSPAGKSEYRKVENVMFGCGHWNRGLFHGAAGLLGLGRGPLSFASQLQSLYGHSFSYCLVDRNSNSSVSSKLIFGEDKDLLRHPNLNFTSLVGGGKENPVDTFYYVQIKSIVVGGEVLDIPQETWQVSSSDGSGGTIIDSGTTLSYFADPAYDIIKEAFLKKIKGYPLVKEIQFLHPCYNISAVEQVELPEFTINFADGAVWNFPVENYFITLIPDELICLAMMGTPRSALSIIGNYQQQNFHILYDTKRSRLGYAPMRCADYDNNSLLGGSKDLNIVEREA